MLRDLRYSLRSLWKSRGLTVVGIITLALGIGTTTAIFTLVYGATFRSLPYADSDRLVRLVWRGSSGYGAGLVPTQAEAISQRSHSFSSVATVFPSAGCNLSGAGGNSEYVIDQKVSSNFFRTLGVTLAAGRDFSVDDSNTKDATVAIIS